MNSPTQQPQGSALLSSAAIIGGIPTTTVDVPICAVFLALYLPLAVTHGRIYRSNARSPSTSFKPSILIAYMCFLRVVTMSLRIAWSQYQTNTGVAIAAQIFTTAGVLLLYLLNVVFCQRILRAWHPRFGWSRAASLAFPAFYALIPLSLIALISCFVQSLNTTDAYTRQVDHSVLLYGVTFFACVAAFPLPFLLVAYLFFVAKKNMDERDRMAENEMRMRKPTMAGPVGKGAASILCATLVLLIGVIFRAATSWITAPPAYDPAWYDSKACFYCFNFVTEILVIIFYAAVRVDKMFFVPKEADLKEREVVVQDSHTVETKG